MAQLPASLLFLDRSAQRRRCGACESLRLAPSTVSAQIHSLEDQLGLELMRRSGKRLMASEAGELVFRYADEIFSLGQDLIAAVQDGGRWKPRHVHVGM